MPKSIDKDDIKMNLNRDEMIDRFIENININNDSKRVYRRLTNNFLDFCNKELTCICGNDYKTFLQKRAESGLTQDYLGKIHSIVNRFCNYLGCAQIHYEPVNKVELNTQYYSNSRIITELDFDHIRKVARKDLRNSAIVELFYHLGLTIEELLNLNKDCLDFYNNTISIKSNKGVRILQLSDDCNNILKQYLKFRIDDNPNLFLIKSRGIRDMLEYLAIKNGFKYLTPTDFRKTCGWRLINSGIPLKDVLYILGLKYFDASLLEGLSFNK